MTRLVPAWLRGPLRSGLGLLRDGRYSPFRPATELARASLRLRRIRKSLAPLRAATRLEAIDLALMQRIVQAWGNPGWTVDAGFLHHMARCVWNGKGPVLDCGSGLTTIVSAMLTARQGATVWSLEQDARWYHEVRRIVSALHLGNVILWHAPLRSYGDYFWYDLEGRNFPSRFASVLCDGPAVRRSEWPPPLFESWRVGAVPVLDDLGVTFDRILLDDAVDPRAPGLLARWRAAGITLHQVDTATGRHLVGQPVLRRR